MIPKSGYRFSEKIMLKQQAKAKSQFNLIPFRFSAAASGVTRCAACRFFTARPPGMISSTFGSVRADTGLCERHGVFTTARGAACPQFEDGGG
jgi:recombinational DNA repair protein RecR